MIPAALPQVRWLMEPECESSLTGDCFAIARQEGNNTPYHMYYDRHGQILNCPGVDRVIFLKHKHKVRWQRTGLVFYKIFVRSGVITYNLANRVRKLKTLFRASMFPRNMTLSSQHTWILIQSYTCEKAERWATMCRILFNKCHRIVRSQVRSLNVMRCAWWMSRGVLDECLMWQSQSTEWMWRQHVHRKQLIANREMILMMSIHWTYGARAWLAERHCHNCCYANNPGNYPSHTSSKQHECIWKIQLITSLLVARTKESCLFTEDQTLQISNYVGYAKRSLRKRMQPKDMSQICRMPCGVIYSACFHKLLKSWYLTTNFDFRSISVT